MALFIGDLQLGQEFCLCAVLILQSPGAAGAPIPAVGQLDRQSIFACFQQVRHVVGLILDPLPIVRNAGGANEIAHTLPVDVCLIQSAGSDIQPGFFRQGQGKFLPEAVHRVAFFPVDPVIPGDPLCFPMVNAGLKGGLRPVPGSASLVPEPDLPEDLRSGCDCWAAPGGLHGIRFHFSAVPKRIPRFVCGEDLVSGLLHAAFAVPGKPGWRKSPPRWGLSNAPFSVEWRSFTVPPAGP